MNPETGIGTEAKRQPGSLSELFHAWRYFFWLLALIALVLLFYAEENWRGEWAWNRYKREKLSQGELFDAANLLPAVVADDENFAMTPALAPLFDFIPGTQKWSNTNALDLTRSFSPAYDAASGLIKSNKGQRSSSWTAQRTDLIEWQLAFQATGPSRLKGQVNRTNCTVQEAAAAVLAALSESNATLEELHLASQRPHCRFNIHYQQENPAAVLLPHLAALKRISQVLQLRASAELALDQTDAAFQDVNLMFFLADASRDEPILVSHLVRFALLQLALQPFVEGLGSWSEPQLRSLEERLLRFDFCADIKRTLQAEQIVFGGAMIDYLQRSSDRLELLSDLAAGGGGDLQLRGIAAAGVLLAVAPNGWFNFERLNLSRIFEQDLLPTIDLADHSISPRIARKIEESAAALAGGSALKLTLRHRLFATLLLPSVPRLVQKTAFAQTAADMGAVASALERFRLKQGAFPESLEGLAPEFIVSLPHDIINGLPIHYRRLANGQYLLYSVGWNELDDRGAIGLTKNGESVDLKAGDWVWKSLHSVGE